MQGAMPAFLGKLFLLGETDGLVVQVSVVGGQLLISTNAETVGEWSLSSVVVRRVGENRFSLEHDDETVEFVVAIGSADEFAVLVTPNEGSAGESLRAGDSDSGNHRRETSRSGGEWAASSAPPHIKLAWVLIVAAVFGLYGELPSLGEVA